MQTFSAALFLVALSVASAAPGYYGHGTALAGPVLGPNSLTGPANGPSALAGPVVGPAKISGAVDLGATVTGAVAGPASISPSISHGTAILGGPGPLPAPAYLAEPYYGYAHGPILAGPAHLAGPIAPAAYIAGPSGYITAGPGPYGPYY